MQAKTERFEMRLDQGALDGIDTWRAHQHDVPSRAEAVRRLTDAGLNAMQGSASRSESGFSDGEKLILMMLCGLHRKLKIEDGIDPDFLESVIGGGHYWALKWRYTGIFHGHEVEESCVKEVADMLDMWWFIEVSHKKFSNEDKELVKTQAEPFGEHVLFSGFDGNYETEHLSVANFIIRDLERFEIFHGRDLNSHVPSVDGYRRMLAVFEPMRPGLVGRELEPTEVIRLLNARLGPAR